MIQPHQKKMIESMPKAENHIHIEGSIPLHLAVELAEKNHVLLPCDTAHGLRQWIKDTKGSYGLNGFMYCNRKINSVCVHEEDYEAVVMELAKQAKEQNIIYQELFLDYPLNEERGIPIEVVMDGYITAKKRAMDELGVELVYIAGLDRTLSSEQCVYFVKKLEKYLDYVDGLGMDCEEKGHPCRKHVESYRLAEEMGLFLTAHAGEDAAVKDGYWNIWDALELLHVKRIDHGCQTVKDPALVKYLAEHEILCTICPTANVGSRNVESFETHPAMEMFRKGIPCSINSDNPPCSDNLNQNYEKAIDLMGFTEQELVDMARIAFKFSIKGDKYLPLFDRWKSEQGL